MERLIKHEVIRFLTENKLISLSQHGFVKSKSCVTNLLETMDIATEALNLKGALDIIYLDYAKAFDTIPHKRLIHKIDKYGFGQFIKGWISAFLKDRKQRVILGEFVSEWIDVLSGVPQGSVLGPILFILYINDLPDLIENMIEMFADDTKISAMINNVDCCLSLESDLQRISNWTNDWLVALNAEKCKVMHIGDKNPNYSYDINNTPLLKTTSERDLGIIISNDLKWSDQVNACANRANMVLGMVKRTFKFQNIVSLSRLYKAFVRPHLEYGVQVWNPHLKKDIAVLESVQRRATKLAFEVRRLDYNDRIKAMNLTTLETRRLRGDLIQMFKIVKGIDKVNWFKPLLSKNEGNGFRLAPRSHEYVVERQLVKNCDQRYNFFTNRVSTVWNRLTNEIVNSTTVNEFKNKIDLIDLSKLSQ